MTSAHRNDATGHGALMANVAHEEERARHASCTTRLLEYGLSVYRVSRVFNILSLDSAFFDESRFLSLFFSIREFIPRHDLYTEKKIEKESVAIVKICV